MYNCKKCKDKGSYEENGSFLTCVFCGGRQKCMMQLKISMANAKSSGNKELYQNLVAVKKFLPQYPVMAVLEAEAREMLPSFISFLRLSFDIKAFHEPTIRGVSTNRGV